MDRIYCADVWFSTAKEQKSYALAKGVDPRHIHTVGDGAEGFESAVAAFRGRGGRLGLVGGFYILGQDTDTLKARLAKLRGAQVIPYDFETGETDGAKLYAAAMSSILGSKIFRKDKRRHKKLSARGGSGKGRAAKALRDGIAAEFVLRNIANCDALNWDQKVALLDGRISEATLRRHYLDK